MDGFEKWAIWLLPIGWAVWWLWWKLPKRETAKLHDSIPDPKDRVDVEDTLRKTISQALSAIAVLIGAGFALAQFLEQRDTAQKQIAVSQDQVKISQQQVQASHDLLISNQIAKGFEQLGSDKIEVRLGGIYALEGILHMPPLDNTSPDYQRPVLEALCAFIRDHTIDMTAQEEPATDVQAVLTVIGRRSKEEGGLADLSYAIIPGANLSRSNLMGINLSGTDLSGSQLRSTNLSYAGLIGTDLSDADLTNANLRLANLTIADLSDTRLAGANLSDAKLTDADLTGADLSGVHLDNQEQLSRACGKPKALPEGFNLDRPCPVIIR